LAQAQLIDHWFKELKSIWELRFEKLNEILMETQEMNDLTVNATNTINAPIQTVFDAWLNAETLAKFILPMPGMPNPKVENDAREGGKFSIIMQVGDDKIPHTGEYLEINRHEKLVFSWESPSSVTGSKVTLLFSELGKNQTTVKLSHVKFADEETRANHDNGWNNILEALKTTLNE